MEPGAEPGEALDKDTGLMVREGGGGGAGRGGGGGGGVRDWTAGLGPLLGDWTLGKGPMLCWVTIGNRAAFICSFLEGTKVSVFLMAAFSREESGRSSRL